MIHGISRFARIFARSPPGKRACRSPSGECGPDSAACGDRARFDEGVAPPNHEKSTPLGVLVVWHELTKKMPLIFSLTKSFSSAIWTFCDARIIEMDCNIYLIPFGFEFGFTFWTNVCFRYYNYIQDNKQDKYGNGYKIPRDIEMATKPIHLTG